MLKSKRKSLGVVFCGLLVFFCIIASFGFQAIFNASASEQEYFSAERYTDNDTLLKEDGSDSSKDIQAFVKEVNQSLAGTSFPELAEVIPRAYLESTEKDAVFQYNGKEYGFYMVKEGDYFDLLLIDFVYEFKKEDQRNNEYIIGINPLLQQSFVRIKSGDTYQWKKSGAERNKYYVANPRFLAHLQNENALNYGDAEYRKEDDEGLIIQQSRVNYGSVSYKTEEDLWEKCLSFVGKKAIDYTLTAVAGEFGPAVGVVLDLIGFGHEIYEEGKEVTILTGNESNIMTRQSKTDQKNNPEIPAYSRVAAFASQQELILSSDENSYAEFITLLNDTNYRSRLTQVCDFDIVRRKGNWSSMEYVAGNAEGKDYPTPFSCMKERILFDKSVKQLNVGEEQSGYSLPNGTDCFSFQPSVSGTYYVSVRDNCEFGDANVCALGVPDAVYDSSRQKVSVYLQANTTYQFETFLTGQEHGKHFIKVELGKMSAGEKNCSVNANGELYRLEGIRNAGYHFSSDNPNIRFELYNERFDKIDSSRLAVFDIYLQGADTYYLRIVDTTSSVQNCTIKFEIAETVQEGTGVELPGNDERKIYRFQAPNMDSPEYYTIVFSNISAGFEPEIYGNSNPASRVSEGKCSVYNLYLEPEEEIYIAGKGNSVCNLKVMKSQVAYKWIVNGEELQKNEVSLKRGGSYSVRLFIDGNDLGTKAIYSPNGNGYSFANNALTISRSYNFPTPNATNPYIYLYAINDNLPCELYVFVTHDLTINFEAFNNNSGYGFGWNTFSADSQEKITINYTLYVDGHNPTGLNLAGQRVASHQNIMSTVETQLAYKGVAPVQVTIESLVLSRGAADGYIMIYNTLGSGYSKLTEMQKKQSFTAESIYINPAFGQGGRGDSYSPYQIGCVRHLNNIRRAMTAYYDGRGYIDVIAASFKLTDNITVTNWKPIEEPFYGTFDGDNHFISYTMSSVSLNKNNAYGFFSYMSEQARIQNLYLSRCEVILGAIEQYSDTSTNVTVGLLVGYNYGGTIRNVKTMNKCYLTCETAKAWVGGLVGYSYKGTITECSVEGGRLYSCGEMFGGVCGTGYLATIDNNRCSAEVAWCHPSKSKAADDSGRIGGIVGQMRGGSVSNCTFSGRLSNETPKSSSSKFKPAMGMIIGAVYWTPKTEQNTFENGTFNPGELRVVTTGVLWWTTKHYQNEFAKGEEIGRVLTD